MGRTFRARQRQAWKGKGGNGKSAKTPDGWWQPAVEGLFHQRAKIRHIVSPLTEKQTTYHDPGRVKRYAESRIISNAQETITDKLLQNGGFERGSPLLDVGCGTGTAIRRAQKEGYSVTGIDISGEMLKFGRRSGTKGVRADMFSLPFRENSFGGIISASAIQWAFAGMKPEKAREASRQIAAEFIRVLKPGAVASIQFFPQASHSEEIKLIRDARKGKKRGMGRQDQKMGDLPQGSRMRKAGRGRDILPEDMRRGAYFKPTKKRDITPQVKEKREKIADAVLQGFRDAGFRARKTMRGRGCYLTAQK